MLRFSQMHIGALNIFVLYRKCFSIDVYFLDAAVNKDTKRLEIHTFEKHTKNAISTGKKRRKASDEQIL